MFAILATTCYHSNSLLPTNALLKETLSGVVLRIDATLACLCRTILYKVGYWSLLSGTLPSQVSSQNLIWVPSHQVEIRLILRIGPSFP
jgi:hypothetical protein